MAQKVLQIEKYGSTKLIRYFIGDLISYQMKGEEVWNTAYIEDFNIEQSVIIFPDRVVAINDINEIRKKRAFAAAIRTGLYSFGLGWAVYGLIGGAVESDIGLDVVLVPAVSVATGWLFHRIFRYKKYKLGKRRWLRVVDLTF